MASLTLPVRVWGLLDARAEDRVSVAPSKAAARAMANFEGAELIRTFPPWMWVVGFVHLDATNLNDALFVPGKHKIHRMGSKRSETSTTLSWSSGVSWSVIFHWSAG